MESLIANVALVGLFPAVGEFVVFVVAFLMETFATELANKWFIAGMYASVCIEGRGAIESFTTGLAFVGFFGSVYDFMTTQRGRLSETFATDFAHKGTGSSMHWHMSG